MPVVETLFGTIEFSDPKPRRIKFKTIKAVYETLTVNEAIGNYLKPRDRYTSPSQISSTFSFLRGETKEYFLALHLDGKNRLLAIDICSIGSLSQSIIHPREIFKTALLSSAAVIVVLHNHPTGDSTPSNEDVDITKRLMKCGDLLGIRVIDHIIIGEDYYSFVEGGII